LHTQDKHNNNDNTKKKEERNEPKKTANTEQKDGEAEREGGREGKPRTKGKKACSEWCG
jgi:hypothetical protein